MSDHPVLDSSGHRMVKLACPVSYGVCPASFYPAGRQAPGGSARLADVPGMDGGPGAGDVASSIPWFRRGVAAWIALAAGVLAWDLTAPDQQTLSEAFRRRQDSPVAYAAVAAVWGLLTAHLFGVLPARADPLHVPDLFRRR